MLWPGGEDSSGQKPWWGQSAGYGAGESWLPAGVLRSLKDLVPLYREQMVGRGKCSAVLSSTVNGPGDKAVASESQSAY